MTSSVTIRKPPYVLIGACVLLFIPVGLLFAFSHRVAAGVLFVVSAFGLLSAPWSVTVTEADIFVQAPLRRVHYPLSRIKDVVFVGTTAAALRLELVDGTSVLIKGFGFEGIDDLYKASLAAWKRATAAPQEI